MADKRSSIVTMQDLAKLHTLDPLDGNLCLGSYQFDEKSNSWERSESLTEWNNPIVSHERKEGLNDDELDLDQLAQRELDPKNLIRDKDALQFKIKVPAK